MKKANLKRSNLRTTLKSKNQVKDSYEKHTSEQKYKYEEEHLKNVERKSWNKTILKKKSLKQDNFGQEDRTNDNSE